MKTDDNKKIDDASKIVDVLEIDAGDSHIDKEVLKTMLSEMFSMIEIMKQNIVVIKIDTEQTSKVEKKC